MENIPSKAYWRQILTLMPDFFNCFISGCMFGWTPNAIIFFQEGNQVKATPSQSELLASIFELGRSISAIPCGILIDRIGRKTITIGAGLLNFSCWILLSFTSSISVILFARFSLGVAAALIDAIDTILIGELASPAARAKFSGISSISFNSGLIIQSIISISFSSYFILNYFSLVWSALFFITLFWLIETPYYLISVSKTREARLNLEYIRKGYTKEEIDLEFNGMQTYISAEKKNKKQVNWLQFMKTKSIRKPLISAILICFFTSGLGSGLIGDYVAIIIPKNNIVPTKYYPIIMDVTALVCSSIFPLYAEKFPRRTLFFAGVGFVCINNLLLGLTDYLFIAFHSEICKCIFIFLILSYKLGTNGCVYQMTTTMKSELFPQSVKGLGSSLCVVFQSLGNLILFQSYDLVTNNLGQYFVFIILALNALILYSLVYFRLPETRGRYLADLQRCPDTPPIYKKKSEYGSFAGRSDVTKHQSELRLESEVDSELPFSEEL